MYACVFISMHVCIYISLYIQTCYHMALKSIGDQTKGKWNIWQVAKGAGICDTSGSKGIAWIWL